MSNAPQTVTPTAPPLASVLCTEKLDRRPSRPPDYEGENRALVALAQALADSPQTILQTLADTILTVFQCDSGGVSLVTEDGTRFYWPAIAGAWKPHIGGGTPRDFGPCGDVLDRDSPLLFSHFERRYTYFAPVMPPAEECLLVPFYVAGKAVGTIWAIIHDDRLGARRFDREDLRTLVSLGTFASAAYQAEEQLGTLRKQVHERHEAQLAMREMNEALLVSSVRQHELAEQAKNAERKMGESELRYRRLFEAAQDAILILDGSTGRVTEANGFVVDLLGYDPADLVGKELWQIGLFEDVVACRAAFRELREKDHIRYVDVPLATKQGQRVDVELVSSLYTVDDHEVIQCNLRDISDRKRAEDALRDSDRHKDKFLATLAHELRNPLAPMRTAAQVLRFKGGAEQEFELARDVIDRQVQQLSRLVDDLLDLSRISRGKINVQLESVVMADVVARAVEISRPLIDARKHHLEIVLPEQTVRVEGDAARLAQVVSNLLNNAAKYTEEGGHIWLIVDVASELSKQPGEVLLRVRDTGVGIAADSLPRIFEMFSQVQGSVSRSEGGLGIGLNLVRSLVELHRGSVTALSEGLGRGSEFIVRLPRFESPAATAGLGEHRPRTRKASARRILVVDDNMDAADTLAVLLRATGHAVRTAYDGPTALDLARLQPPDVVLLDIGLPGTSGLEVARRMRQDLGLTNALLVALTGFGQDEDRRQSKEAGFNAHLVKPVDLDALYDLLEHAPLPVAEFLYDYSSGP